MERGGSSRRGFLEILVGAGALATLGAILYPVFRYIVPPVRGEAKLSQLKLDFTPDDIAAEAKKAKYFKYGRELGIIFFDEQNNLKAFTATCTHLECTVQNRPDWGLLWCACHNGKFGYNGGNVSGPPPKPLKEFKVKVTDGVIFVSKEEV